MRVLVDECLPRRLKAALHDHECSTVPEAGFAGKKNGELLALAAGRYDVLITIDAGMPYQQNWRVTKSRSCCFRQNQTVWPISSLSCRKSSGRWNACSRARSFASALSAPLAC